MSTTGTEHDHREYVAGCFRCDLSRDEVSGTDEQQDEVSQFAAGADAMLAAAEKSLTKDADPSIWWFVGEAINRIREARKTLNGGAS